MRSPGSREPGGRVGATPFQARPQPGQSRSLAATRAWLYAGDPAAAWRLLAAVRAIPDMPRRRSLEADTLGSYLRLREARFGPGR